MLSASDLIHLPYTTDLTEGGIAYACRWLATKPDHMSGSTVDRLRRIIGGVAVELAIRRALTEQAVPFRVLGSTPFTQPDRYNVSLGGHRCNLKSFLITRRPQIAQLRKDPTLVLQAPALVPVDQFAAEDPKPGDLLLFAFLLGVLAAAREDMVKAAATGQPVYLIHPLPEEWRRPVNWLLLENLALKSECETPITVEIGGQNTGREFVTAMLELPPKKRVVVEHGFHSLAYIHATQRPEARIGLYSSTRGEAIIVPAQEWGNLWVYGMDILMIGWLSHEEYRRKAKVLNAGMRTMQYDRTRVKNLFVRMEELNPLRPLFERTRAWAATQEILN